MLSHSQIVGSCLLSWIEDQADARSASSISPDLFAFHVACGLANRKAMGRNNRGLVDSRAIVPIAYRRLAIRRNLRRACAAVSER